ncbi:hypothetical protein SRHO_G00035060 [Serrasalmus rhombeus]
MNASLFSVEGGVAVLLLVPVELLVGLVLVTAWWCRGDVAVAIVGVRVEALVLLALELVLKPIGAVGVIGVGVRGARAAEPISSPTFISALISLLTGVCKPSIT